MSEVYVHLFRVVNR